jgi:hypothetical protein
VQDELWCTPCPAALPLPRTTARPLHTRLSRFKGCGSSIAEAVTRRGPRFMALPAGDPSHVMQDPDHQVRRRVAVRRAAGRCGGAPQEQQPPALGARHCLEL